MALAEDEHGVRVSGRGNGALDGTPAIRLHYDPGWPVCSRYDRLDDGRRVLGPGVVRGDERNISLRDRPPHGRSLFGVAITAGADDGDHPTGDERSHGGDDLVDTDTDTVPDFCDVCTGGDDLVDTDTDEKWDRIVSWWTANLSSDQKELLMALFAAVWETALNAGDHNPNLKKEVNRKIPRD